MWLCPLKGFYSVFSEIREINFWRKVPLTVVPFLIGGKLNMRLGILELQNRVTHNDLTLRVTNSKLNYYFLTFEFFQLEVEK